MSEKVCSVLIVLSIILIAVFVAGDRVVLQHYSQHDSIYIDTTQTYQEGWSKTADGEWFKNNW